MTRAVLAHLPIEAALGPAGDEAPDPIAIIERVGTVSGPALVKDLFMRGRALIREHRPDVVLAMHPLAGPAGIAAGVPTGVMTHGGELRSRRIRALSRRVFRRAAAVVANSRFTARAAIAAGAPPERVTVIPVGVDPPVEPDPGVLAAVRARLGPWRILLCVARLEPHKGQDVLIDALPSLPDDVRLVLVGEGSARAELELRAAPFGERVVFAGRVADDELPAYYQAASAFALLSRETAGPRAGAEGGGIVLLEACSYGLPVVGGATGGIPETITHGVTGLLVDPDQGELVAKAVTEVLVDDALARRLAEAGKAEATTRRTWGVFTARLGEVLREAAG